MSGQRLAIDWTLCDGHGLCARMWPERIGLDPWGFPLFTAEVDDAEVKQARQTIGICPRLALRLESR